MSDSAIERAKRTALVCGALPLVSGLVFLELLSFMHWNWLMGPGLYIIYFGSGLASIGVLSLLRFCWLAIGTARLSRVRQWIAVAACGLLLLSNFPLAGLVVLTATSSYTVVIYNASEATLTDVTVFGGGCDQVYGSIPPSTHVRRTFWIHQQGVLKLRATDGTTTDERIIDDYVMPDLGGQLAVSVESDGTVSIGHGDT